MRTSHLGHEPTWGVQPIRNSSDLVGAKPETLLRVKTASIIFLNEALLRHDFPEVRDFNHERLEQWFLDHAAVISKPQAAQDLVNSKIQTDGTTRPGYRPPEYGRANVVEVSSGGLFDIKGSGAEAPRAELERNGLATLGSMIREYILGELLARVADQVFLYKRKGLYPEFTEFNTARLYGLINLGFWVKLGMIDSEGRELLTPASILVRQARNRYQEAVVGSRPYSHPMALPREVQNDIERTLRAFGISSAVRFRLPEGGYSISHPFDQLNIQGTDDFAIVDFGSFWVSDHFDMPAYYTYTLKGDANLTEADLAFSPADGHSFVQPKPELLIPIDIWGDGEKGEAQDNLELQARAAADAIGLNGDRKLAVNLYHKFLDPVDVKFKSCRVNSPG